jgi:hypothetical protein
MNIEDINIEDAADANYVIKKYFNNDLKNIKMTQLEQLVLTVYNMGKNSGGSTTGASDGSPGGASDGAPAETEPKPAEKPPEKVDPPFKINDRVKVLEDLEIGHSGEFIKADSEGTVSYIKGNTITALFEAGEFGEMIDVIVLPDKIEKI